jgi:hypothetical protein
MTEEQPLTMDEIAAEVRYCIALLEAASRRMENVLGTLAAALLIEQAKRN